MLSQYEGLQIKDTISNHLYHLQAHSNIIEVNLWVSHLIIKKCDMFYCCVLLTETLTHQKTLKHLSIIVRVILFSNPVFWCLVAGLPLFCLQAASLKKPYLTSPPSAVTLRSSEVITLVHNAVCKSKSGSCWSTQQISAEPQPQRVWKEEEEVAAVSSL